MKSGQAQYTRGPPYIYTRDPPMINLIPWILKHMTCLSRKWNFSQFGIYPAIIFSWIKSWFKKKKCSCKNVNFEALKSRVTGIWLKWYLANPSSSTYPLKSRTLADWHASRWAPQKLCVLCKKSTRVVLEHNPKLPFSCKCSLYAVAVLSGFEDLLWCPEILSLDVFPLYPKIEAVTAKVQIL